MAVLFLMQAGPALSQAPGSQEQRFDPEARQCWTEVLDFTRQWYITAYGIETQEEERDREPHGQPLTPRQEIWQLREAARVLADNGQVDECRMLLAEMRELADGYAAGQEPGLMRDPIEAARPEDDSSDTGAGEGEGAATR
ncbi:hypothetical protein [Telmatospirillum sp. J64-1]|uniref:hypothetical protein n=1 Tax=Telmatospirillum sp. J64-1 TaxID=2502183 RepID=UPI00115CB972|nr:hypothetical protein [Telmatospirillum sp. J64-1]